MQQLAALSGINPQELAAQTAQNAGLAQAGSRSRSASPVQGPTVVSPAILASLQNAAAGPQSTFAVPPSPDLAGSQSSVIC